MKRHHRQLTQAVALSTVAVLAAACGSSSSTASSTTSSTTSSTSGAASGGITITAAQDLANAGQTTSTAFCGTKKITLGIQDGYGTNAWSQESLAAVRSEAAMCPNVKTIVELGEGSLQTSISQINSMVAQGINALTVIPDFGSAELPAIEAATKAGVKVVPWGADPGGTAGTDYVSYVDWSSPSAGTMWAKWMATELHGKGNVVMTGGPAGNPVTTGQLKAVVAEFKNYPNIHLLTGDTSWAVTNWNPATAQQIMGSLLSKYSTINGVISDYGTDALAETRAFTDANRSLVPIATLDTNGLSCLYDKEKTQDSDFQLATISSRNWLGRVAARKAIAAAEGVTDNEPSLFTLPFYENSSGGLAPKCTASAPADYYGSNDLTVAEITQYGKA